MTEHHYIPIGLPLPIDVFTTLGDLINKAWPGANIITSPAAAGVPYAVQARLPSHGEWALIQVPHRAAKKVSKKAAQEIAAEHPEDSEFPVDFNGMDDQWVKLTAPRELMMTLGSMAHEIIGAHEGAINYLEWEVHTRASVDEPESAYVLSIARSKGQTPGALRTRAEEATRALAGRVRALQERAAGARTKSERDAVLADLAALNLPAED